MSPFLKNLTGSNEYKQHITDVDNFPRKEKSELKLILM